MGAIPGTARLAVAAAIGALLLASRAPPPPSSSPTERTTTGVPQHLAPGQGQTVNGPEAGAFLGGGVLPDHYDDQSAMYEDLVFNTPGLSASRIDEFFKDGSFGVKPADVARTYSPGDGRG